MTDNLKAEAGALNKAADAVDTCRDSIASEINRLEGVVADAKKDWQGAGANSFQKLLAAWNTETRRVNAALNEFSTALRDSDKHNLLTDENEADLYTRSFDKLEAK